MKPTSARRRVHGLVLAAGVLVCTSGHAQNIATDGTTGIATSLQGPRYDIVQGLGRVSGGNLFHSFSRFGVGPGESARFSTDSVAIANVFARVTGGERSTIAGTIALVPLAGGRPDLYLINPAGVIFRDGAAIDVPGAFHASTADSVRFADGEFPADPNRPGTLSSAPPEAFGFLADHRAEIRIEGVSMALPGSFAMVAGDITLDGGGVVGAGGSLRVVARGAGAGAVGIGAAAPQARGTLTITAGGHLATLAPAGGDGGAVRAYAGDVLVDGAGAAGFTGILTRSAGAGAAGTVEMDASGALRVVDGGSIGSDTLGSGRAGSVVLRAARLVVDGAGSGIAQIASDALPGSSGAAGSLSVQVGGELRLVNGGSLRASTLSTGNAGDVALNAGTMLVDGGAAGVAGVFTNAAIGSSGTAGSIIAEVAGAARVVNGGRLRSTTFGRGDAGAVSFHSAELSIDGGAHQFAAIHSDASFDSAGNAGPVQVRVDGLLDIADSGYVSSSTFGAGTAGRVEVSAGALAIDGGAFGVAGILSDSNGGAGGPAGTVAVRVAGDATIRDGGLVSSSTFSARDAGQVAFASARLTLDGTAAIKSSAGDGSSGAAGRVDVDVAGEARLLGGGRISSATLGSGDAGSVRVSAGALTVRGSAQAFSGIFSNADSSDASAGSVDVSVGGNAVLSEGGLVRTSAGGSGQAGTVRLSAGALELDGGSQALAGIFSDALAGSGSVQVEVAGDTRLVDGGFISSDTFGVGDAGSVSLHSGNLSLEGRGDRLSGIFSNAFSASSGAGGSVRVRVDDLLRVGDGGHLSASAFGRGAAGAVDVAAARVVVEAGGEIAARAGSTSAGQPGDVSVGASRSVTVDGGSISIQNNAPVAAATVQPTRISVRAPEIRMLHGGEVSAAALGEAPASDVRIDYGRLLSAEFAAITTEALDGNGGRIEISGRGAVVLRDAAVVTSVFGVRGNGGDIRVSGGALLLDSGFVQANTAARAASGGDVLVAVGQVIPSAGRVLVGGDQPFDFGKAIGVPGFNVIQAAAPTGVGGTIRIPGAIVDLAGSLSELRVPPLDPGVFGREPCRRGGGSRFAVVGRGRLPIARDEPQRALPAGATTAGRPDAGAVPLTCRD